MSPFASLKRSSSTEDTKWRVSGVVLSHSSCKQMCNIALTPHVFWMGMSGPSSSSVIPLYCVQNVVFALSFWKKYCFAMSTDTTPEHHRVWLLELAQMVIFYVFALEHTASNSSQKAWNTNWSDHNTRFRGVMLRLRCLQAQRSWCHLWTRLT